MLIPVIQNGVDLFVDSAQIAIPWSSVFGRPAIVDTLSRLPNGAGVLVNDGAGNLAWASIGGGSVTSVGLAAPASFTVTGSPVTGAGTLTFAYAPGYVPYTSLESSKLAGIAASATVGATWGVNVFSRPNILINIGALANAAGLLANDGAGNVSWYPTGSLGTVTQINTNNGTTGGPITTTGTVSVDQNFAFAWTGQHRWDLPLWAPDGTAALPAYTFRLDPDTGMYSGGANVLAFATAGAPKYQFGAAGELGIGGAVYGTVGQSLLSGGVGAATTWGNPTLVAANFANPTNPGVDLVGSNGTATTGLRSDAVMVLAQNISPAWTGHHQFQGNSLTNAGTYVGISIGARAGFVVEQWWSNSTEAADEKVWRMVTQGDSTWTFDALTDALGSPRNIFQIARSGVAITLQTYGNSTDNPPQLFYGNVRAETRGFVALGQLDALAAGIGAYLQVIGGEGYVGGYDWTGAVRVPMNYLATDHKFDGELSLSTITTSASASIGGATALPALPVGYITVTIAGTARKLPYYAT